MQQVQLDLLTSLHLVGQANIVDAALARQRQTCQVTRDAQALLPAHEPERPALGNLQFVDLAKGLRREQSLADLRGEDRVLADVGEGVIVDPAAINRRNALFDLVGREPLLLPIRLPTLAEHVRLLGHLTQPVPSHDIGVCNLCFFARVGQRADVLVQEALLDARLDLGNDRARVDVEVLGGALPDAVLDRRQ